MREVAVVVPTLGRPHRIAPVQESFSDTAPASVLFVVDHDDRDTLDTLQTLGAAYTVTTQGERYAAKIRRGIELTDEPYVFCGGDDLDARPGWFEKALEAMVPPVEVVGVNDLLPRDREHATHFVMTRAYAERPCLDGNPGPFSEAYNHWYCDDELIATAVHRGVYAYAPEAQVYHLHPMAERAEDDETYRLGRQQRRLDQKKFKSRSMLWT